MFTKNQQRLPTGAVAAKVLAAMVAQTGDRDLLSDEHFPVDDALIETWTSLERFRPKDDAAGPGRNVMAVA